MAKIQKEKKVIIAYTYQFKIKGTLFTPPGTRLSDFMSLMSGLGQKKFLPVTDALVTDVFGNEICRTRFLELNRDEIVFLLPASELEKRKER